MASIVTQILSGGLVDGVSKVINSIRGKSPEDAAKLEQIKAQYQTEFMQADHQLQLQRIQENIKLNEIAGENVRADAQSGDKYVARARPSVIWVGLGVIIWNYCLMPVLLLHWQFRPIELPAFVWQAWLYLSLGVVFTRSADKAADSIFGGAGGAVQLPFGMKAESKGE